MSNWAQDLFHVERPIITMCRLQPLPGDPYYNADGGMEKVMTAAKADLFAPQGSGVDDTMFSNEFNLPYLTKVEPITIAAMTRVIGKLKPLITIPYGINCLQDPIASIDLTVAVDDKFIHEIISGVYASNFGLWNTNVGKAVRHKVAVGAKGLKPLFDIVPEAAGYLADKDVEDIVRSTEFNSHPDALYIPGLIASNETDTQIPGQVKASVKRTPILYSIGCNVNNITGQLSVADGVACATIFKYDSVFGNAMDVERAKEFMDKVKEYRTTL